MSNVTIPKQFEGLNAEQLNALFQALVLAAADYRLTIPESAQSGCDVRSGIYQFLDEAPTASLVCELVNSLNKLGWSITQTSITNKTADALDACLTRIDGGTWLNDWNYTKALRAHIASKGVIITDFEDALLQMAHVINADITPKPNDPQAQN